MARVHWLAVLAVLGACGKKNVPAEPIVGWHQEEEWAGACYFPPNFDALGVGDRKLARQKVLAGLMEQWGGGGGTGVTFSDDLTTPVETVLLGEPEHIEEVSVRNLAYCKQVVAEGASTADWQRYLRGLPEALTVGECKTPPLDYTLFDVLDVGREWHVPANVCEGNVIRVKGSTIDKYQISTDGPMIDVTGDPDQLTTSVDWPCNVDGCRAGMLIMRFTGESGVQSIWPVGKELIFTAPEHGRIEVQINDTTWYDNKFRIEGGIEDHTAIEYSPAE